MIFHTFFLISKMANDFDVVDFFSKKWIKFQDMNVIVFLHDFAFFVLAQTAFYFKYFKNNEKRNIYKLY